MEIKSLSSVKEVAKLLDGAVSINSLYRAISRKEIAVTKLGARVLIPRQEVEKLLGMPERNK